MLSEFLGTKGLSPELEQRWIEDFNSQLITKIRTYFKTFKVTGLDKAMPDIAEIIFEHIECHQTFFTEIGLGKDLDSRMRIFEDWINGEFIEFLTRVFIKWTQCTEIEAKVAAQGLKKVWMRTLYLYIDNVEVKRDLAVNLLIQATLSNMKTSLRMIL